jgi:acyl-CoA synthetase (AMP-forming)/AMP-acid ligase II
VKVRGGAGLGAAASLVGLTAGVPPSVLRRGGIATAIGVAAHRSPDRAVVVRGLDTMTGRELDAAVGATASALVQRWPAGGRVAVRGDGGIDFLVVLAAAGVAGIDVIALGPRAGELPGVESLDSWSLFVRGVGFDTRLRRSSTGGSVSLLSTGTTGTPTVTKRGRLGVRGMLQLADADRRLRMPEGPVLVLAPPDHGHGLTMVLAGLARGRIVVLASGMRPAEQAELAARHRVSTLSGVPAQLGRLVEAAPSALDGVRLVVSGSSRLPAALRARLESGGARVLDCYGSTETGTVAIEGRPLAGVTIELDAAGRILIRSPLSGVTRDTGDLGHVEHGRLVVDGRHGEVVDSGGELVSPEVVAAKLRALPGVESARVWAEDDDLLGSVLCAEVRGYVDESVLRRALPRAEMPRRITLVE